jgi:hypothetical protein
MPAEPMTSISLQQEQVKLAKSADASQANPVKEGNDMHAKEYHIKPKKVALMKLIAQEILSSFVDDDADGFDQKDNSAILQDIQKKRSKREAARKKAKRKANAERKQKQVHLLHLHSDSSHQLVTDREIHYSSVILEYETKIQDDQELDDDSFAGLDIEELTTTPSYKSSSSSSNKAPFSDSGSTESMSKGSTMSVEEIRNLVMANIPQTVRDQIPSEAWGEIFQGPTAGSEESSQSVASKSKKTQENAPIDAVLSTTADDLSVMSDVTGFITTFPGGKKVESRLSMSFRDIKYPDQSASEVTDETSTGTEISSIVNHRRSYDAIAVPSSRPDQGAPKTVQFGMVTLRCYERILSDNPAVQNGPAIGIGWRYKRGGIFDVEEFELGRTRMRVAEELILPREVREKMLKEAGIPQKDIADMVRDILKSKNQRKQTINNLHTDGVEEAAESARKRFGRLLRFGRQSDMYE